MAEEQGYTYQCITSVVAGGIDDATITFATDDGTVLAHQGRHVHLANGRSLVRTAVTLGDVCQGTCG